MHDMCAAALKPDPVRARELNNRLLGLHRHLFVEANPIPVKWALTQTRQIGDGIRLPLTPLSESGFERVRSAMQQAGIKI
jgi:4-hydroxy-tetrahydrodipicolinate synthase